MAVQEINDLLNEVTPEEMIARKEAALEREQLQKSGVIKKIADKIRQKPPAM